jgi:hypothetical protein
MNNRDLPNNALLKTRMFGVLVYVEQKRPRR